MRFCIGKTSCGLVGVMARTLTRPRKAILPLAPEKLIELHEDFARSSAPHQVDREAGIIRRVKVLGRKSPNNHGKAGARSTEYTLEAMREALARYADCPVNIDHRDRRNPHADRSALDRFGKLVNPVLETDGVYADLLYLRSHPMADRIAEAAERAPDLFGMSHEALGDGHVANGVFVITALPHIRSVDLVADPGSVNSLFESRESMNKTTPKKLLESGKLKPAAVGVLTSLLELGDDYADMPMDVAPVDDAGTGDHTADLVAAIGKLVQSTEPADHELAKKILGMLKPAGAEALEPVTEDDDEDGDKKEKAMESRQLKQENAALKLCLESGVKPSGVLLKALVLMESEDDMKALIAERTTPAKPAVQKPRSQGPAVLTESNGFEDEYRKNFERFTGRPMASVNGK